MIDSCDDEPQTSDAKPAENPAQNETLSATGTGPKMTARRANLVALAVGGVAALGFNFILMVLIALAGSDTYGVGWAILSKVGVIGGGAIWIVVFGISRLALHLWMSAVSRDQKASKPER